jgi:hypothetical protein
LVTKNELLNLLASTEIKRREKLLAILAFADGKPLGTAEIKKIAKDSGLREIEKWNVSGILGKTKGFIAKVKDGWILTTQGQAFTNREVLEHPLSTKDVAKGLRLQLSSVKSTESRNFVVEAILCLEADAFKAAVVFSWIGAISVLYDYVILNRLADFNHEAKKRDARWKTASTRDDMARMKEVDFLDILGTLSILGKNVKEHLKNTCLNLRNSCGHPSSLKVGKHNVEAHIEFLIQNVFAVF